MEYYIFYYLIKYIKYTEYRTHSKSSETKLFYTNNLHDAWIVKNISCEGVSNIKITAKKNI